MNIDKINLKTDVHLSAFYNVLAQGGRAMTAGEVAMARDIFGDHLDYAVIRIHQDFPEKLKPLIKDSFVAIAPYNHIYYADDYYAEDYSVLPLDERSTFIHELVHCFQFQNGVDTIREHFKNLQGYLFLSSAYNYFREDVEKGFGHLNIEQQARFVENLFILMVRHKQAETIKMYKNWRVEDFSYEEARDIWLAYRDHPEFHAKKAVNLLPWEPDFFQHS